MQNDYWFLKKIEIVYYYTYKRAYDCMFINKFYVYIEHNLVLKP